MKKLYLKDGKEVKMGDIITVSSSEKETPYGKITLIEKMFINERILPDLIKAGIVIEKEEKKAIPMDLDYYINKVANRLGEKPNTIYKYFNLLDNHYPAIPVSMLLKEIALELDKQYEGHIKNSNEIWIISLVNGKIMKLSKEGIKSFKNFASFRSKEDALLAYSILEGILKDIFNE